MRLQHLDTLRAFAVLLVMFEHYAGRTLNAYVPLGAGFLGVGLFFTLSGFLITSILLQSLDAYRGQTSKALFNFYARRFLRLIPPYYLLIAALVALNHEPIASSWPWHVAYLTNIWIVLGNPSNVFWSLAVEEQFYLIWPVFLVFWPRNKVLWLVGLMILLGLALKLAWVLAGFAPRNAFYLLFANLSLLGIGAGLGALCYRNGRAFDLSWLTPQRTRLFGMLALAATVLAVVPWLFSGRSGLIRYFTLELFAGLLFGWLIIRSARGWEGVMGRVFDNPVLQYIGRISYGLYLVHNFVPKIITEQLGPMPDIALLALTLPITFAICALSWRFVEQPILSLKRFVPDRPQDTRVTP